MSGFRRVRKYLIPILLIVILSISIVALYTTYLSPNQSKANPNAYIGVAFCGNTTQEAKLLIDRVKSYTNLFILDSGRNPVSENRSKVEEIGDYAVSQGLNIIVNLGVDDVTGANNTWFWNVPSLDAVKQNWTERWGTKFLGIYYNDEVGGVQLDAPWREWFATYGAKLNQIDHPATNALYQIYIKLLDYINNGTLPQNYTVEANFFAQDVVAGDPGLQKLNSTGFTSFTSDYGLYWWNYLGGYNVMFTELGWNSSVAEQIALVKGAARLQNREWGAMITWKYNSEPYLDTGDQIYNQMLSSYEAGAKYIAIFNYPYNGNNNYGVMTDSQFIALQRFWSDINQMKYVDQSAPVAALVLPQNYGWGMRSPNDSIWGFWPADSRSVQIGLTTSKLLAQYGVNLDIVFDDPAYPVANGHYKNVYYWNSTGI